MAAVAVAAEATYAFDRRSCSKSSETVSACAQVMARGASGPPQVSRGRGEGTLRAVVAGCAIFRRNCLARCIARSEERLSEPDHGQRCEEARPTQARPEERVERAVGDELADPARQLVALVGAVVPLVRKDDDAVVRLSADDAAGALRRLPDGVEGEEVRLVDGARVSQELEPRAQHPAERVLEGHAEQQDGAPVVAVKVDALRNLAARDREEDGAAAAVARALEVLERHGGLEHVGRLDEDELVLEHLQGDVGRYGEMWGDVGRYGEIWGGMGR